MSNNFFNTPDSCTLLPHLRRPYTIDSPPKDIFLSTFGMDVQSDCVYWVKRGWSKSKESWLIGLGRAEFSKNATLDYKTLGLFSGNFGAVDCNYRTEESVRIAKDLAWLPLRGVGRSEAGGKDVIPTKGFFLVNVNAIKDKIYAAQSSGLWHISLDTPDRYCRQIESEVRRGNVWDNQRKSNHFLDCEVYAFVAALLLFS